MVAYPLQPVSRRPQKDSPMPFILISDTGKTLLDTYKDKAYIE